jgi:hypothetical protein
MLLGPEHGLVPIIELETNALSPTDSTYCLLRVSTTYPSLLDFAARPKKFLIHRAVRLLYHDGLRLRLPPFASARQPAAEIILC